MTASPRVRKSDRTRARILEAAIETFRSEGVAGTRLAQIADKAGLQTASLYYYYESKDVLIDAVVGGDLDDAYEQVKSRIDALPEDAHEERVRAAMEAHLEHAFLPGSAMTVSIYGQLPRQVQQRFAAKYEAITGLWTGMLEAAEAAGVIRQDISPRVAALLVIGALNWATEWHRAESASAAEIAMQATAMLGINAPG